MFFHRLQTFIFIVHHTPQSIHIGYAVNSLFIDAKFEMSLENIYDERLWQEKCLEIVYEAYQCVAS